MMMMMMMMGGGGTRLEAGCGSLQESHCSVLEPQTNMAVLQTWPPGVTKPEREQQATGLKPLSDLCTRVEETERRKVVQNV